MMLIQARARGPEKARMWSRWVSLVAIAAVGCGGPAYQAAKNGTAGTGGTAGAGGAGGSTPERDAAAGDTGEPRRPNVLVLLTDDQRADTVHALGNSLIHTPTMDRLVRAGTSFTQASCQGGIVGAVCVTSRASLMTGRTINHLQGAGDIIPPEHTTLPELLRKAGYFTFATGKWHNDRAAWIRSFDYGDNIFFGAMHFPSDGGHEHPLLFHFDPTGNYPYEAMFHGDRFSSVMYADAAVDFIQNLPAGSAPFFAYVAFTAPHDPRTPPPPYDTMYDPAQIPLPDNFLPEHPFDDGEIHNRDEDLLGIPRDPEDVKREIAAYYGMISEVDEQMGRVVDAVEARGLLDNTVIVFAADNGLAIGSHGLLGKQNVYDCSVRVPMIVAGPGIAANATSDRYVYLADVLATVASLLGLGPPASSEGTAVLGAGAGTIRSVAYHQYAGLHRGIRTADHWKLIGYRLTDGPQFDRLQLFDLDVDPDEINDLSAATEHQSKLTELQSVLASQRALYEDPLLGN